MSDSQPAATSSNTTAHLAASAETAPLFTLSTGVKVFYAQESELADIVAIYNQSIASKKATADLLPITTAARQAWFDAHLCNEKRPIYVVKNAQGKMIAWGSFSNLYERPAYHISSEISIYVDSGYQGQGIASELITWMLTQAPSLGIHKVVALIFAHNEASLRLFRRLAFQQWGMMPQVCDMDGFIADVVMLGKAV